MHSVWRSLPFTVESGGRQKHNMKAERFKIDYDLQ